jgi:hypothetical protein
MIKVIWKHKNCCGQKFFSNKKEAKHYAEYALRCGAITVEVSEGVK